MMYSFAQRNDCTVVDEPLYAYYLKKTNIDHPGREETLKSMSSDRNIIIDEIQDKEYSSDLVFFKNMAHHFIDLPNTLLDNLLNVFLFREPKYVIASYIKEIQNPKMSDLGYKHLLDMSDHLKSIGKDLLIIDSKMILKDPEMGLRKICKYLDIAFDEAMLKWEKGGISEDGPWAKYWYKSLHKSEGFMPFEEKEVEIPKRLHPLLKECEIIYEILQERSEKIK